MAIDGHILCQRCHCTLYLGKHKYGISNPPKLIKHNLRRAFCCSSTNIFRMVIYG
jgi:hypothetical protein